VSYWFATDERLKAGDVIAFAAVSIAASCMYSTMAIITRQLPSLGMLLVQLLSVHDGTEIHNPLAIN
jgi:hypothetical protein